MEKQTALFIIIIISTAGVLFSGYLTYSEKIKGKSCKIGCSSVKILGEPPCIYGLLMYSILLVVAILGYLS